MKTKALIVPDEGSFLIDGTSVVSLCHGGAGDQKEASICFISL